MSLIEKRFKNKFSGVEAIIFESGISLSDFIKKHFYELMLKTDLSNKISDIRYWTYTGDDVTLAAPIFIENGKINLFSGVEFKLADELFTIAKEVYSENSIRCHYWHYSQSYLLPSSVDITNFVSNPSNHKALENIFHLSDRENIKKEFENAKNEDGDYSNLLEQVSNSVTNTFRKIWKDFRGTSIQLMQNGNEILIKVVDKAKYTFEDRSDGFKKFISILLMLSTQSRTNKILERDLILIDEPDQSLYPTSAQHLKDELIEISKKSKIIFSTHSQYMIDSACLDRHIVVEKKDDITTLKKEDANAPYTDDELLRRAIGASIFECIKPKNIVFEGYLDKELFNKYCKSHKKEKEFKDFGQVYLSGILGAETLAQILILANKKFIIVADSDQTSKSKKADFEKNYPNHKKCWLGYDDVAKEIETMEDFFVIPHLESQIKESGYPDFVYDESKNAIKNIEKAVGNDKIKKQDVKNLVVKRLAKEHIKDEYGTFVSKLKETIDTL